MLKRILFALVIPGTLGACVVTAQPTRVAPRYVAACPAGYVYHSYTRDCRLVRRY